MCVWRGDVAGETVLAAECRVTCVQGLNDFEFKRARCQNREAKRRMERVTLAELKRNPGNWLGKYSGFRSEVNNDRFVRMVILARSRANERKRYVFL